METKNQNDFFKIRKKSVYSFLIFLALAGLTYANVFYYFLPILENKLEDTLGTVYCPIILYLSLTGATVFLVRSFKKEELKKYSEKGIIHFFADSCLIFLIIVFVLETLMALLDNRLHFFPLIRFFFAGFSTGLALSYISGAIIGTIKEFAE